MNNACPKYTFQKKKKRGGGGLMGGPLKVDMDNSGTTVRRIFKAAHHFLRLSVTNDDWRLNSTSSLKSWFDKVAHRLVMKTGKRLHAHTGQTPRADLELNSTGGLLYLKIKT